MGHLVHQLIDAAASRSPDAPAVRFASAHLTYADLFEAAEGVAGALVRGGLDPDERVAVYLEKRLETVYALFGTAVAGGVFVPVNPLLKPAQVAYILRDCNVRVLVTSAPRLEILAPALVECPDLHTVVIVDNRDEQTTERAQGTYAVAPWAQWLETNANSPRRPRRIDADMAAILYTSGSTGQPKGVVLSHRNLVAGAESVSEYLENTPDDRLLAALPLSFDYGLSQLTTAFRVGASVTLINYLLPRDVVRAVERDAITGLAAVPPLWIQLAQLDWPEAASRSLRYITNSGGAMPGSTLAALRERLPDTRIFLMYGLTEAFRSTYLPPEEIDRRPGSMGRAIPNAEVMVLREDGSPCAVNEPGELVHRGALVSMGYWNAPEKTAERFKTIPGRASGLPLEERAVWSGDTVKSDEEGFLYFVGRRDEMIKTSGYRVSPNEIEEVIYATSLVGDAAAIGIPHPTLGQAIVVLVSPAADGRAPDTDQLLVHCKQQLPGFMVPTQILARTGALPRNANGKIDRNALKQSLLDLFEEDMP